MRGILTIQLLKGSLVYFLLYALLFALHIVFAANDYEILFRLVAITITIITFFVGIMIIYFGNILSNRVTVNRYSCGISILLSIGLGWAYSEMSWALQIIYWPLVAIFCHLLVERFWLAKHDLK
tara:strand:- start:5285 stop:5656 length:372 start_codon:yes stop_codon:yes gene_type:complete